MDIDVVRQSAIPLLDGVAGDYDAVLQVVDGARVVILGIGWPGSHELFQGRVELTKRLIADMGFSSVCLDEPIEVVEAIDTYLMGRTASNPVGSASGRPLAPGATWHNAEMLDFVAWLRTNNDLFGERHKVRACATDGHLQDRSVIWADWHVFAPENGGLARIARQRLGRQVVLVGFTSSPGTTLASNDASPDSLEAVLHRVHMPQFILRLRDANERVAGAFRGTPAEQLDILIHFDRSRALEALFT